MQLHNKLMTRKHDAQAAAMLFGFIVSFILLLEFEFIEEKMTILLHLEVYVWIYRKPKL